MALVRIDQKLNLETKALEPSSTVIGEIRTYYGGLEVLNFQGKYYWGIDSHDGIEWQEIPEYLYNALIKFEKGD